MNSSLDVVLRVVLTHHAMQRIAEQDLDKDQVKTIVRRAAPYAPRWPRAAAALDCEALSADPLVKYFPRKAVVTTLLPRGVPLKPRTEVVYV